MTEARKQSKERMIQIHISLASEYLASGDRICADFHIERALYLRRTLQNEL